MSGFFLAKFALIIGGIAALLFSPDSEVKSGVVLRIENLFGITSNVSREIISAVVEFVRYAGVIIAGYFTFLSALEDSNEQYYKYMRENKWQVISLLILLLAVISAYSYINYYVIRRIINAIQQHRSRGLRFRATAATQPRSARISRGSLAIRLLTIGAAAASTLIVITVALAIRLSSGPINLDLVTPWLVAAIEENLGANYDVKVGGTQIEHTASGNIALRFRDIVLRNADGNVVASAPKAEVGLSGASLLDGYFRAESLNLVGAEIALRIDSDGNVTIPGGPTSNARGSRIAAAVPAQATESLPALLSWINGIGETGIDGKGLRELGVANSTVTIDDERIGERWTVRDIGFSLDRPAAGGVAMTVGSDNPTQPWGLTAAIKPARDGNYGIKLEGRHVSVNGLLLATRFGDRELQSNLPLSVSLQAEIGPNGMPRSFTGRIVGEAGFIGARGNAGERIDIERAEAKLSWDADSRTLSAPFQIVSGGNRMTLMAEVLGPAQVEGVWSFKVSGGTVVLTSPDGQSDLLTLNRINVTGRLDPAKRRLTIDNGDIGDSKIGVAMSGNVDYSGSTVRIAAGLAGTSMSVDTWKRLWPIFISTKLREWFLAHLMSGTVQRLEIALSAPLNALKAGGPSIPDGGLAVDATITNCVIRPIDGLPLLRDADLNFHIAGRDLAIASSRATADLPSGRRLLMRNGTFNVPNPGDAQPSTKVSMEFSGDASGVLEFLAMDRIRTLVGPILIDPATVKGIATGQAAFSFPLADREISSQLKYTVSAQIANLVVDQFKGQKIEANELQISASTNSYKIIGLARINRVPTNLYIGGELPFPNQSN